AGDAMRPIPRGFTLVELLVVLSLIALIFAGLFAGLRLVGRAGDGALALGSGLDEVEAVQGFLRRTLAEAMPFVSPTASSDPQPGFFGSPLGIQFIGAMPPALRPGGPQLMDIRAARKPEGLE